MPKLTDQEFETAKADIAKKFGFEPTKFDRILELMAIIRRGPSEESNKALANLKKMKE